MVGRRGISVTCCSWTGVLLQPARLPAQGAGGIMGVLHERENLLNSFSVRITVC